MIVFRFKGDDFRLVKTRRNLCVVVKFVKDTYHKYICVHRKVYLKGKWYFIKNPLKWRVIVWDFYNNITYEFYFWELLLMVKEGKIEYVNYTTKNMYKMLKVYEERRRYTMDLYDELFLIKETTLKEYFDNLKMFVVRYKGNIDKYF